MDKFTLGWLISKAEPTDLRPDIPDLDSNPNFWDERQPEPLQLCQQQNPAGARQFLRPKLSNNCLKRPENSFSTSQHAESAWRRMRISPGGSKEPGILLECQALPEFSCLGAPRFCSSSLRCYLKEIKVRLTRWIPEFRAFASGSPKITWISPGSDTGAVLGAGRASCGPGNYRLIIPE